MAEFGRRPLPNPRCDIHWGFSFHVIHTTPGIVNMFSKMVITKFAIAMALAAFAPAFLVSPCALAGDPPQQQNSPPVIDAGAPCNQWIFTAPGLTVWYTIQATDPESNPMVMVWGSSAPGAILSPHWWSFSAPGEPVWGTFCYTPTAADLGKVLFNICVCLDYVEGGGSGQSANCATLISVEEALSAELSSFTAKCATVNGPIAIAWETSSEIDNALFNIYRSQDGLESAIQVNAEPVVAKGGPSIPASYSLLDEAVLKGHVYHYWLESVDIFGGTQLFGPVTAVAR
jgi:hypothetical protein